MATKRTPSKAKSRAKPAAKTTRTPNTSRTQSPRKQGEKAAFPKHSLPRSTRIANAILDQAAGKACTPADAAKLFGLSNPGGAFAVEVASSLKYGILERPESGQIQPTALARKILRPQNANDPVEGYREAIMLAPVVSDVYQHYRGENIPDDQFFRNALAEKFNIPSEDFSEFKQVFIESLEAAQLLAVHGD